MLVTEVGFDPLDSKNSKKQCFTHRRISTISSEISFMGSNQHYFFHKRDQNRIG